MFVIKVVIISLLVFWAEIGAGEPSPLLPPLQNQSDDLTASSRVVAPIYQRSCYMGRPNRFFFRSGFPFALSPYYIHYGLPSFGSADAVHFLKDLQISIANHVRILSLSGRNRNNIMSTNIPRCAKDNFRIIKYQPTIQILSPPIPANQILIMFINLPNIFRIVREKRFVSLDHSSGPSCGDVYNRCMIIDSSICFYRNLSIVKTDSSLTHGFSQASAKKYKMIRDGQDLADIIFPLSQIQLSDPTIHRDNDVIFIEDTSVNCSEDHLGCALSGPTYRCESKETSENINKFGEWSLRKNGDGDFANITTKYKGRTYFWRHGCWLRDDADKENSE